VDGDRSPAVVRRLFTRLRAWIGDDTSVGTDGDTVDDSGAEYRDPAYNGRYEAEREVERIAEEAQRIENESEFDPEQS